MAKITRFKDYSFTESMVDDFISSFGVNEKVYDDYNPEVKEILKRFNDRFGDKRPTNQEFADFYHELRSEGVDGLLIFDTLEDLIDDVDKDEQELNKSTPFKRIEKKVLSDLKLDAKLVFTFGAGIGALYPVVQNMMQNLSLSGVEMTQETTVLLTIACITIVFLEEKKYKTPEEEEKLTKDSKSMLEELRMRGIGDGIVKKVMKSIESIKNVFAVVAKHLGAMVGGVIDMFGYTAILIPIMNAILWVIGKYDMSVDAVIQNFFSLGAGIASRIAKHGLVELINKLKGIISNKTKEEIIDELETPVIQRFSDIRDKESEQEGDLIKEQ
jgi:hypothetical protein